MSERVVVPNHPAPSVPAGWPGLRRTGPSARHSSLLLWGAVTVVVLAVAVAWVLLTDMRPSYDAFGWLDWGRQTLAWSLNTDGAPSWKPLPYLFTLPYALFGSDPQVWLWMFTATAGGCASAVFAYRIAFRLSGPAPNRRWAPVLGGLFAGGGVLGLNGLSHQVLIANSDPMTITLCLAAIDAHLCRRPRLAFLALELASLGRPEAWAFSFLYAVWAWRAEPELRALLLAGLVFIPAAWLIVPELTSHGVMRSANFDLNLKTAIHGNKIVGVFERLRGLYELPMQLMVLAALALAAVRRDRRTLGLAGAALLWVVIEIGFAYYGFSAVPRYLLEPAAVFVVLAGVGVGWILAHELPAGRVLRWAPIVLPLAVVIALVPTARSRARITHGEIDDAHVYAKMMTRLEAVIRRVGGPDAIKDCGQPVTLLGNQSEVAWAVGLSVGKVGWRPGVEIGSGKAVVQIKPHDGGWQVRPFNTAPSCRSLRADSKMN